MTRHFRVLDFYSGIGGAQVSFEVLEAFDVNTVANEVYKHNFQKKVCQKGIDTVDHKTLEAYRADMWVCSPPCQPYTVQGNRKDMDDPRAQSFLMLLDQLSQMSTPPSYILIENVKGFEVSRTFEKLCGVLRGVGMDWQVQTVSPLDLGIPNQRTRVFVLAKRTNLKFSAEELDLARHSIGEAGVVAPISNYLGSDEASRNYFVPLEVLDKHGRCVDVASAHDKRTCCFTKNYFRYVEGTGSLLQTADVDKEAADRAGESWLPGAKVRYFTPSEVSRLHHFPASFNFPEHITDKQRYQLLGNSLNVHVVASLVVHIMDSAQ